MTFQKSSTDRHRESVLRSRVFYAANCVEGVKCVEELNVLGSKLWVCEVFPRSKVCVSQKKLLMRRIQNCQIIRRWVEELWDFRFSYKYSWFVFYFFSVYFPFSYPLTFFIPKGQLISKCPFSVKTSSKNPTKFFPGFLP